MEAFQLRQVDPSVLTVHTPTVPVSVTYLEDPTLRYGDVIALEGRLIVFRGDVSPPHRASDFAPLDQARTLGGVHDRELHDLDDALARAGLR